MRFINWPRLLEHWIRISHGVRAQSIVASADRPQQRVPDDDCLTMTSTGETRR